MLGWLLNYELTRRGSVTAVADALWITPSAVSQHLSALEREVGVALAERAGRGVKPTDAGRRLALDAERVLAALDVAQSTAHELAAQDHSALRVAAFPSVVLGVLAPALTRLRHTQPDLTIDVIDVEGIAGLDHVRLGRADVAVVDDWGWDLGTKPPGLTLCHCSPIRCTSCCPRATHWQQAQASAGATSRASTG